MPNFQEQRLPKALKRVSKPQLVEPRTAEDFCAQGADCEDSGDRWVSSDLCKALRFYHSAFLNYQKAIERDSIEAYYNSARLLFHVYMQYVKNEGVDISTLENVGDAVTDIVKPIQECILWHERAVDVCRLNGTTPSWDLLFNMALAYCEAIELENSLELVNKASDCFMLVLEEQSNQIRLSRDLENASSELQVETDVTEETLLETLVSSYRLVQSAYEAAGGDVERVWMLDQALSGIVSACDLISQDIRITDELRLAKTSSLGYRVGTVKEVSQLWMNPEIADSPEKLMLAGDNIQFLIDTSANLSREDLWESLTAMNKLYKQSQDALQATLKSLPIAQDYMKSGLLQQICALMIARADIDLQRSSDVFFRDFEPSAKNRSILSSNCHNLLKSAVAITNQSGGLRETVSNKLMRLRRKNEAMVRLCILERKSQDDILKAVGEGASDILLEVGNLGYYGV